MPLIRRVLIALTLGATAPLGAQSPLYYQGQFPPEEFQARWRGVLDRIGNQAMAIVQGAPLTRGYVFPRQTNEFYYLSGVETPHSYLLLDGRTRRVTLFLPPRNEGLERSEGRILSAADADQARRLTGVDSVASTAGMTREWMSALLGRPAPAIYTLFSPAERSGESRGELQAADAAIAEDDWDGRPSREAHFVARLRSRFPRADVRDLTPVLDELRSVKSPREIALVRRASELAGHGLLAAMRSTKAGVWEYQLDAAARYVFLVNNARLEGYRSITASGSANIWNAHYYRNDRQLQDGDLVLMDFAPDYAYYTSDVARMWPVNGRFSPVQRELLQFVLEYRNAILRRIRPGVTAAAIREEVLPAMDSVLARTRFSKPIYEQAARRLVQTGGGVFSHPVGLAVHDDGPYAQGPLAPGHVFSVDPQLWVPEENLYFRYEDVIVITATGYENFTPFLPTELADIERLVGRGGMLERFPPR